MTTATGIIDALTCRGVILRLVGDAIEYDAPVGSITDADIVALRNAKAAIVNLMRSRGSDQIGEAFDPIADALEVDPADVPHCDRCGELCDSESVDGRWHCTPCDPVAAERRRYVTRELIGHVERLRRRDRTRLSNEPERLR